MTTDESKILELVERLKENVDAVSEADEKILEELKHFSEALKKLSVQSHFVPVKKTFWQRLFG